MRFDEALTLIRELEPKFAAAGYHLGLTGSVLYKGESEKDLDLIVYAHDVGEKKMTRPELEEFIRGLGFHVLPHNHSSFYDFNKEVLVCYKGDTRVDFFHLN